MTKLSISQQQKIRELVLKETPEGIYQMVLDGRLPKFPTGFWSMPENYDYGRKCTKHLIQNMLHWDKLTISKNIFLSTLRSYKLCGMTCTLFNNSTYATIDNAYPNIFLPWENPQVPNGFWNLETASQAIRWLFTVRYKWNRQFVLLNYTTRFLKAHGLSAVENITSMFNLLNLAFPNEFKKWELKQVPNDYWTDEHIIEAVRELYTIRFPWSHEFVVEHHSHEFLKKQGLISIAHKGLFQLLELAFPNEFKPWEFRAVPDGYWTPETISNAIEWLYTQKYPYSRNFIITHHSKEFLIKEGLRTVADFGVFRALNLAFPNEFKKEDFPNVINYKI